MDALSTILASIRLATAVMSRSHYTGPWRVRFELPGTGCHLVAGHGRKRVMAGAPVAVFHAMMEGRCFFHRDGDEEPVELSAGDVLVLPRADPHILYDDPRAREVSIGSLVSAGPPGPTGIADVRHGGSGAATRTVCGTFRLEHEAAEALLSLLPGVLHVRAGQSPSSRAVADSAAVLERELARGAPGLEAVVTRLSDILFIQVLRHQLEQVPDGLRGWLAAIQDAQLAQALALIHADPARPWTAESLARRVGMSRSGFFKRFSDQVGEPPAHYAARQRMKAAADLLREQSLSVRQVAELVGYQSEDAFCRAFERRFRMRPRGYRRGAQADSTAS